MTTTRPTRARAPKAYRPLEKHVEKAIMRLLALHGWTVQKVRQGAM